MEMAAMNAPRYEPPRARPTHTFWPVTRRPEPSAVPRPHDASRNTDQEEEPAHEEPGYGHGV
jgi:hypothetical protein